MSAVKFIHCSDLHIDSPFKGISEIQPDLGKSLFNSTFQSFSNIVDIAIDEQVDCVLVAGDIYDGADKSLRAQLRFRDELMRLASVDIPVYIVHGNHDPLNSWSATLDWPDNVYIFQGDRVESLQLQKNGNVIAVICGISYKQRAVTDNLALKFERTELQVPHIGLLHTNVGNNPEHDPYAPCSIEELASRGMDYWALGHIHKYSKLRESNPAIVYCGSSQSRNTRETGEKGCCLVLLESGSDPGVSFIPTDVVRYVTDTINITNLETINDVVNSIVGKCKKISTDVDTRNILVRLYVIGRTHLHSELQRENSIDDILENVRDSLNDMTPWVWLEKLIVKTSGEYDLDSLRRGSDFLADVISIYDDLLEEDSECWEEFCSANANALFSTWIGSKYLEELTNEELKEIAESARNITLDQFVGTE